MIIIMSKTAGRNILVSPAVLLIIIIIILVMFLQLLPI